MKIGRLWISFRRYGKDDACNWAFSIDWWNK